MNRNNSKSFNLVSWMATNQVAANLLMFILVTSGLYYLINIRQEVQPNYTYASVLIEMSYPGASPEEVEKSIILAVESSIESLEGVSRVSSTAKEGSALIRADVEDGENLDRVLQGVRSRVDNISSFPSVAERPTIRLDDDARWLSTISISGDVTNEELHQLSNRIKHGLLAIEDIIQVTPRVKKERQIIIEVSNQALNSYGLTLPEIAQKIGLSAKDIPSGELSTTRNDVVLRTEGRREQAVEYGTIPIKTESDGAVLTLADVATIFHGFKDDSAFFSYNGSAGMILYVYQSKNSRSISLAKKVHQYIDSLQETLPPNITLGFPNKRVEKFKERISMLTDNGFLGLLLVMLFLGVFLDSRLAFWVGVSIPVVFISSFSILYYLDVSINMISLFAFIMTLGIVVDDAIIIGENIHDKRLKGMSLSDAAVQGAKEMVMPVTFAVITNIIAFIPLLMLSGDIGQYMRSLPVVAIVVFTVSLVEALYILPAHLNSSKRNSLSKSISKLASQRFHFLNKMPVFLDSFRDKYYSSILKRLIKHKYTTVSIFTGLLLIILSWFLSNRIGLSWYPRVPSDQVSARLVLSADSSESETTALALKIESAGVEAVNQLGSSEDLLSRTVTSSILSPTYARVNFVLVAEKERTFSQSQFVRLWREKVGNLPQAQSLKFDSLVGFGRGGGLYVDMRHNSISTLERAAKDLASTMKTITGLVDVSNGLTQGKKQLKFRLSEEAKSLGFSENDLGQQLKSAYFGVEAIRFLRDSEQVKVMLRLPEYQRNSISDLKDFIIRSSDGTELPLEQAAQVSHSRAFTVIERENGKRNISVGGVVDAEFGSQSLIKKLLIDEVIPVIKAKYPDLEVGMRGTLGASYGESPVEQINIGFGLVALVIFSLVASLFKSYSDGIIVMLTIPYSIAAAVAGHILMGFELTSNSIFGMVALSGLVVNGALVLTSRLNQFMREGMDFNQALVAASISRFRPIILTSMTTTVGLLPMLFETSPQALFLVPFAVALSFGTFFSMFVVLILIPVIHVISYELFNSETKIKRTDNQALNLEIR